MSLFGRYVIDRMKRSVAGYLKFPVPPYDDPMYWERVYQQITPDQIIEWGNLSCSDLVEYQYNLIQDQTENHHNQSKKTDIKMTTTWDETIQVYRSKSTLDKVSVQSHPMNPAIAKEEVVVDEHQTILVLGCGNSKLGEDMIEAGWRKSIIQIDAASTALDLMTTRCTPYIRTGEMRLIQDDAMELSAFNDNKIAAVIDKGLIDSIFCADAFEDCYHILNAVHRVLEPNGIFVCLSLSRPEFLLNKILPPLSQFRIPNVDNRWRDIQIRQLDRVLLYRFQKNEPMKLILQRKGKMVSKRSR